MSRSRARFLFYAAPVFVWMAVIFIFSTNLGASDNTFHVLRWLLKLLRPDEGGVTPESADRMNFFMRKFAHMTEYAVLTALLVRALNYGKRTFSWRVLLTAGLLSVAYACTDEFHQRFVGTREAALRDVVVDSVGVLSILVAFSLWGLHRAIEQRLWKGEEPNVPAT